MTPMAEFPVDGQNKLEWVRVGHSARVMYRVLTNVGDPAANSNFTQINGVYPWEKASDWSRSYLIAALEHLLVWADYVAPLKFHPEQRVGHTLRPVQTLARAAIEASAQAVWILSGKSAAECARRHVRLMRCDLTEQRKSLPLPEKVLMDKADEILLARVRERWSDKDLGPISYLDAIKSACLEVSVDPHEAETIWRAASGSTHGKHWPTLSLQHVLPGEEYEPGQFRTLIVPDALAMTSVLSLADTMTSYGVVKFAVSSGADVESLMSEALTWLSGIIPLQDGVVRESLR
jgi:hypothetical protein